MPRPSARFTSDLSVPPKSSAGIPACLHPGAGKEACATFSAIRSFLLSPRLVLLLAAAAALTGCVTTPPTPLVPITGDPVVDGNAFLAVAPPRDRVLWEYRVAAAALRRGQLDEARAKLDAALTATAGTLASTGSSTEAAAARGTFHAESEKPFIGEPYERVMAGFYRGILYWRDGEPDNARALFRNGELIDSDTANKTFAGDWVLLDWLDGYVTTRLGGDGSDALARARKSAAAQSIPAPPAYDPSANVLVFVEYGSAPRKIAAGENGELLSYALEPSRAVSARLEVAGQTLALPPWDDLQFQASTRGGRLMDQILGGKSDFKNTTNTVGDVALAGAVIAAESSRTQTQRVVTDANGRKHVVTETKKNQGAENAAIALGVVGLFSKLLSSAAKPTADTRTWDNLPQYLSFAALRLPPGEHAARLTFYDRAGQPVHKLAQTFTISVPAPDENSVATQKRDTVVFRSEVPN